MIKVAIRVRLGNSREDNQFVQQVSEVTSSEIKQNTLEDYVSEFTGGFISEAFKNGQIKTVAEEELQDYLANPEQYHREISNLIKYEYITNGDIYQLHTLMSDMSPLNYRVSTYERIDTVDSKTLLTCSKTLNKVKYKNLTRDLIGQLCSEGTVVTMWIGNKKNPHLYVFNDINYIFPAYRRDGEWLCLMDMGWFEGMSDLEREYMFETLNPYITESNYNAFLNDKENSQYVELPQDRTVCLRINTMSRNQRLGLPMGTQVLFDLLHKRILKNLEKTIANKIISNIAVLTIGNDKTPNVTINKRTKDKIVKGVGNVLRETVSKSAISCIIVPEYAKIDWAKVDGLDGLTADKFESINSDIATNIGISPALTNGLSKGASNVKYNLDVLYRRIGSILEQIDDIYNKLLPLILTKKEADNLMFEFVKTQPLTAKDELDSLTKLGSMGYSVRSIVNMLSTVEFDTYLEQSLHEIETLGLRERILPPTTSYTLSGDSGGNEGAPTVDEPDSEETIASQEYDKNESPSKE